MCKFFLERVLKDGKEYYKVLGWKGVKTFDELPHEYIEEHLCFYKSGDWIHVYYKGNKGDTWRTVAIFTQGYLIPKSHWETQILPALKQAGERLSKILKEKKENIFEIELQRILIFLSDYFPNEIKEADKSHKDWLIDLTLRLLDDFRIFKLKNVEELSKGFFNFLKQFDKEELIKATKNLFDNRLGWGYGNPYALFEFWIELGNALYGENNFIVQDLIEAKQKIDKRKNKEKVRHIESSWQGQVEVEL